MLKLEDVHTYYGRIEALKGISLEIKAGEVVCLIGANGAGKSTTLMTLSGIYKNNRGRIEFEGQNITNFPPQKRVEAGMSQVPEGRRIFPELTVLENLEIGAYLQKDKSKIKQHLTYVFELFPVLYERQSQRGGTLSGGEQQMLAIARGLMSRPKLLLLDEPSLGLAPMLVEKIFSIIEQINQSGTTIFIVEQNAHMALSISNRGYVMETGRITIEGEAKALLADDRVRKAYLGG